MIKQQTGAALLAISSLAFEMAYLWKVTPTSVKKPSTFFPLKLSLAVSRIVPRNSQHASQGSVVVRAKLSSSFFGR